MPPMWCCIASAVFGAHQRSDWDFRIIEAQFRLRSASMRCQSLADPARRVAVSPNTLEQSVSKACCLRAPFTLGFPAYQIKVYQPAVVVKMDLRNCPSYGAHTL